MGVAEWLALIEAWIAEVGPFDELAVRDRFQASRTGFGLLLLKEGQPLGFVKLHTTTAPSETEQRALACLASDPPTSFSSPAVIGSGRSSRWTYLLTSPLQVGFHRPLRNPPLDLIIRELQRALEPIPRWEGTPDHWRPMHGDLTPWNLRGQRGRITLVDWDEADWAPPHADKVLYWATSRAVGTPSPPLPADIDEAGRFWLGRIGERLERARADADRDASFVERVHRGLTLLLR